MKMISKLMLSTAVILAAGCQNTVDTVGSDQKQVTTDAFLSNRVDVTLQSNYRPDGTIVAQATVVSQRTGFFSEPWQAIFGGNPYQIEYRFDWLDENGMLINPVTSTWQKMELMPGETKYIKGVSPNANARDFKVHLKQYGPNKY